MTPASFTHVPATDSQVVEEQVVFSFTALCRASGADHSDVLALVTEGLLQPSGSGPDDWQFNGLSLRSARSALRMARELELSLHAAAIVMELLAEIEVLKARR
jgi:chaperone modulatory protein CbpM